VFIKKYTGKMSDPLLQVDDMLKIINSFECELVIADTGDGRTSNALMVRDLGPTRFAELYEHGSLSQKIKWDGDKGHYIVNRTRIMTDLMVEIKQAKISFFEYAQFEPFKSDFTGIYAEYSEQTRMTKYDHTVPDDVFHSYMFSRVAAGVLRGEYDKYLAGGGNADEMEERTSISL